MIAAASARTCILRLAGGALLAFGLCLVAGPPALAHANGTSYLTVAADDDSPSLVATWNIATADLQLPLEIDIDGDGVLTTREIDARRATIVRFATERLRIRRGGADCLLTGRGLTTVRRQSQPFLSLDLTGRCKRSGLMQVSTSLFFGSAGYSALLDIRTAGGRAPAVLTADAPSWTELPAPSMLESLQRFLHEGIWHIWRGYDHLAFLLLLLLPAVLEHGRSGWVGTQSLRAIGLRTLGVVSAFTLAHSITLSLATLGIMTPPTAPVEAAIAASVVLAGLANLIPRFAAHGARMAFGFGLIHGFGFATALQELGLMRGNIAAPLAGFNIGVELGQLAVVAMALPILALLRQRPVYHRLLMPGASAAVASLAAWWLLQRVAAM